MAVLIEISRSKAVTWRDTSGVIWRGSAGVEWRDSDDSGTIFISLDGQALDHYWDAYIKSFSAPQYDLQYDYGGFEEINYGSVVLSPDAVSGDWPPPKQFTILARYTSSTEDLADEIFIGDIFRDTFDETSCIYTLKPQKYTKRLLSEGADYDGNTVPYPKAFGIVTHKEPLRKADVGGKPTYDLAGIDTTSKALSIISFTSASAGTKTKITLTGAHGWSNGTSIIVDGTVNFDGTHTIESVSGATFVIPVAFPTDNSETAYIAAVAYESGDFVVYDQGVPIMENVTTYSTYFTLSASPVGTVTISGTGAQTDLEGVMTWGQSQLGLGSIDTSAQRATSPTVSYWADAQMPLIDFLSDICAFFTHWFYIKSGILYLGDMLLDNGSDTFDENEYFFTVSYGTQPRVSQIKCRWTVTESYEGYRDDNVTAYKGLKDKQYSVIESLYSLSSGTADGTQTGKLINSGATFSSDGVEVGHVARNTIDDTETTVVAVSETALELEDDIFVSGESYVVGPSYPNAQDVEIEPYHDTKSNISTALQNILSVLSKDIADITIPMNATLPVPGKKITFTDDVMVVDTTIWIRARTLQYDFENEKVMISGEGVIA